MAGRVSSHRWLVPAAAATLGLLLLLRQPAGLLGTYDLARMHECYKHDFRAALLAGEWPWWNPYTALGRPFFADLETACAYPPSWLVLPLGVAGGILAMVWLHVAVAVAGGTALGEHLGLRRPWAQFAALAFTFSGAVLARIQAGQLQLFFVLCLLPGLLRALLVVQDEPGVRPVLRAAGWLVAAILAGSPQMLWCGLVPLAVLVVARSANPRALATAAGRLAAAGLLAVALTAFQVLPFLELVAQGNRPLHEASFATRAGVEGSAWLTALVPPGGWLPVPWELDVGLGPIAVGAAVLAIILGLRERTSRALALAAVVAGLLALGSETPLLPALAEWVPGFAGVRYPGRYALAGILAATLLAALALQRGDDGSLRRRRLAVFLAGAHLAWLAATAWLQGWHFVAPAPPAHEARLRADLLDAGLPRDGAPPRAALPAPLLLANAGLQAGLSTVSGFNNPALARTWLPLYRLSGLPAPDFHRAEVTDEALVRAGRLGRFLSLSVYTTPPDLPVHIGEPLGPRVFLAARTRPVANWTEALDAIAAGHDFVAAPLVEGRPAMTGPASAGTVRIRSFARNRVTVECDSSSPALLVLAEAWYPGWTAAVDGATAEVVPANAWMRTVSVPAGRHTIEFTYFPTGFAFGAAISLAALIATITWLRRATSAR